MSNPWHSSLESLKTAYVKELSKCEQTIAEVIFLNFWVTRQLWSNLSKFIYFGEFKTKCSSQKPVPKSLKISIFAIGNVYLKLYEIRFCSVFLHSTNQPNLKFQLEKSNEKFRERIGKLEQSKPTPRLLQRKHSQQMESYSDKVLEVVNIHQTYEQQIYQLQNEIKNLDELCKESMANVDILQYKNSSLTEQLDNISELKDTIDELKAKVCSNVIYISLCSNRSNFILQLLDYEKDLDKERSMRERLSNDRDSILAHLESVLKRNHDMTQHSDYRYIF